MIRAQIQLPADVHARAKRLARAKEISLAELARRGLESILSQYPEADLPAKQWTAPRVRSGGVKVPLERLKDFAREEVPQRRSRRGATR
jgi:hypothetical protein